MGCCQVVGDVSSYVRFGILFIVYPGYIQFTAFMAAINSVFLHKAEELMFIRYRVF